MVTMAEAAWFADPALQRLLTLLNADGGETRIVGGAVRNAILGAEVHEVDLATTLLPDDVIRRATVHGIKAVPTGVDHGTVTLVVDGKAFEVTTLRRDVETDGRHAQVAFGTDWQVDAERRDLTINALYAKADGTVIDLVGGLEDLAARRVRFIGNALQRIEEDSLRILRFFRFFAWYGEGRPDADGLRAAARLRDRLAQLSAERVWSELKKLLAAPDPSRALLWMRQAGVLSAILPESEKWGIDAIHGLVACERDLGWSPDAMLRLSAIVPPDAERLSALAERLRLSRAESTVLAEFAAAPSLAADVAPTALDRLLYGHGKTGIVLKLKLALAAERSRTEPVPAMQMTAGYSALIARAERFQRPEFPLSGRDVLAAGVPAGPRVGALLSELEDIWVSRNFSLSRENLLSRLEELIERSGP